MKHKNNNLLDTRFFLKSLLMSCMFACLIAPSHAMNLLNEEFEMEYGGLVYNPANYADSGGLSDYVADDQVQEVIAGLAAAGFDEEKEDVKEEAKSVEPENGHILAGILEKVNNFLTKNPVNGNVIRCREEHAKDPKCRLNGYQRRIELYAPCDEKEIVGHISYIIVTSGPLTDDNYNIEEIRLSSICLAAKYQNIGFEHLLTFAALNDAFYINLEKDCPVIFPVLTENFRTVLINEAGFKKETGRDVILKSFLKQFKAHSKYFIDKASELVSKKSKADKAKKA